MLLEITNFQDTSTNCRAYSHEALAIHLECSNLFQDETTFALRIILKIQFVPKGSSHENPILIYVCWSCNCMTQIKQPFT